MSNLKREFLERRAQFKANSLEAAVLDILIEESEKTRLAHVLYGLAYEQLHRLYQHNKLGGPDFLLATGMLRILLPHTEVDSLHMTLERTLSPDALVYVRVEEVAAQEGFLKKKGTKYTWPVGSPNRTVIVDITEKNIEITMKELYSESTQ